PPETSGAATAGGRGAQLLGIPLLGGAGCVPEYGVMALPAVGAVVKGRPDRTILPLRTWPI
ncbi:MAG TPA: hypothetical protein VGI07_13065, partial [Solirubrobacteraceae bacterium]